MLPPDLPLSRRRFLKTASLLGLGSLLPGARVLAEPVAAAAPAPIGPRAVGTRPFGKTGVNVSTLSLGGAIDTINNQLLLKQALDWGVTYWDTAEGYGGGKSETGFGHYFEKNPAARKRVFLVTKSKSHNPAELTQHLERSLERLRTDYVDLYFLHVVGGARPLTAEVKAWAEGAKKSGQIRFFGFSTHGNMESCLRAAAKLGWIDGIMVKYNFRSMHTDAMRRAVDACAQAGIGLTAMKTQGGGPVKVDSETELKMAGQFLERGFTQQQARLKAVWENDQVAAICSSMPNLSVLMANIAAALDRTKLSALDHELLRQHADETRCGYCAGCTRFCEGALAQAAPIGDVMRYLMYYHSYGDRDLARELFAQMPAATRRQLPQLDYTTAEQRCPNGLPIARLMQEATERLG